MHLKFNDSIQTYVLTSQTPVHMYTERELGGCPTNDISIEFENLWQFVMLLFITYSADHSKILHMSRHHSNTVVTYAKLRCDRLGTFEPEHAQSWSNFEFDRNIVSGSGVTSPLYTDVSWHNGIVLPTSSCKGLITIKVSSDFAYVYWPV